jgi:hypothetical protein
MTDVYKVIAAANIRPAKSTMCDQLLYLNIFLRARLIHRPDDGGSKHL